MLCRCASSWFGLVQLYRTLSNCTFSEGNKVLSLFLSSLRRNVGSLSDATRKVMTFLILNTRHGFETYPAAGREEVGWSNTLPGSSLSLAITGYHAAVTNSLVFHLLKSLSWVRRRANQLQQAPKQVRLVSTLLRLPRCLR